jgi:tRNA-dihydrouridine synthase C
MDLISVRIFLAPMEGVVNHSMRAVLTSLGGIDRCVTEFIRVTDNVFPERVFFRYSPELHNGGRTAAGTPVYIQLLGSHPQIMAANAAVAAQCGAPGIDINFGCPSKLVNRNQGGSILLRTPERLYEITREVRKAVPADIPVTVKIRLGYNDSRLFKEITQAIFAANPSELVIHARTKVEGYKPPAHWHRIQEVQPASPVPLIANGEVWTLDDYRNCLRQSGCRDVMIGRGILARPDLPNRIKQSNQGIPAEEMPWRDVVRLLLAFLDLSSAHYIDEYLGNPVKQWLVYLKKGYAEMEPVFDTIKRLHDPEAVREALLRFAES